MGFIHETPGPVVPDVCPRCGGNRFKPTADGLWDGDHGGGDVFYAQCLNCKTHFVALVMGEKGDEPLEWQVTEHPI